MRRAGRTGEAAVFDLRASITATSWKRRRNCCAASIKSTSMAAKALLSTFRLGRYGPGGQLRRALCAGGVFHPGGSQAVCAPDRLRHRAGRRGCQDPVPHRRHRGADERQLCRRHRRLHRPDGHPAEDERRRDEPGGRGGPAHLYHRFPLRLFRQERRAAPHQPGRPRRGHRRPASTRPWSARPLRAWPRAGPSRATSCIWAVP